MDLIFRWVMTRHNHGNFFVFYFLPLSDSIYIYTCWKMTRYGDLICKLQTWSSNTMRMLCLLCNSTFLSKFFLPSLYLACQNPFKHPGFFKNMSTSLFCFFPYTLIWLCLKCTDIYLMFGQTHNHGTQKSKFVEYHVLSQNCSQC